MAIKNFKDNIDRIKYLTEKQEEISTRQENNLVLDFDQALKEANKKQIEIKLLGKTYFLPSEMPFNFSTFFLRHCYKKVKGQFIVMMPEDKMLEFLELMFGRRFVQSLENSNNSNVSMLFVFQNIVPKVLKEWGYDTDVDPKQLEEIQKKMLTQG